MIMSIILMLLPFIRLSAEIEDFLYATQVVWVTSSKEP